MRWRDFASLPALPDDYFDLRSGSRCVHFIGIGGIGMSALAFALAHRGHHVSGSDAADSPMLAKLREAGVQTFIGHRAENLSPDNRPVDAVIWGSAISPDNPERAEATSRGIAQWHRAQLLAHFVNAAKFSIAVSGTHGKSTTSAMIAHILDKCGKNPTALLGAEYPPFGSNVRLGDPDLVVVEADESDGSFTLCKPTLAVVTNVEAEHLENYDDSEDELWRAFKQFTEQAEKTVLNADNEELSRRLGKTGVLNFGISTPTDLQASAVNQLAGETLYSLQGASGGRRTGPFRLVVPGLHNLSNALAACLATTSLDVEADDAAASLEEFRGVARRFQFAGEANDILVYDDYAHHPTEVQSTLSAAREFLQRPITAVFQPHRFSRTQQMGHLFGPSFEAAERVIVTQLYSAWEEPIPGVSGRIVFDAIQRSFPDKPLFYAETLDEACALVIELTQPGDAILTMGAGDIGAQPRRIVEELQRQSARS
ncbi:MAG: UDP-N-acetylmuramate--alanine ligase [Abditibacteriota bacterium]|nr:UDP-N-acetylmuramate--alanine ligase [Abditibacteriota bacterium]